MAFAIRSAPPALALSTDRPPLLTVDARRSLSGSPTRWVDAHHDALRSTVQTYGAVLVRGLGLSDPDEIAEVFGVLGSGLLREREAFAPRVPYGGGLYSSSAWPPGQPMCMHHELSYSDTPPGTLLFACLRAPASGGVTGLADGAAVLAALPAQLVTRFERLGWMLVRRFGEDVGASIADAFGTEDPLEVDAYCRAHAIDARWDDDGGLVTRQRRSAVVAHPVTGRACWFNQVAFLSEWTLDPEAREFLLDCYGPDGLPFTTCFGDGEPIGPEIVELLNATYEAHTLREPWRPGDLMIVDNIRTAHSREAYVGDREIVVGLTDEVHDLRSPASPSILTTSPTHPEVSTR